MRIPTRLATIALLAAAALTASPSGVHAQEPAANEDGSCPPESSTVGNLGADVAAAERTAEISWDVNGSTLAEHEQEWLNWSASNVFPSLPSTLSCAEKQDVMANVFWWTLKEGDLGAKNVPSYSNCRDDHKHHAWDYVCPGMWQVGFGVQAWDHDMAEVERVVQQTYGSDEAALKAAWEAAGLEAQGVSWKKFLRVNLRNEKLRRSWLERAPAVGFVLENKTVVRECVEGGATWCHMPAKETQRWSEVVKYAPTLDAARQAMRDVRSIFVAKGLCK